MSSFGLEPGRYFGVGPVPMNAMATTATGDAGDVPTYRSLQKMRQSPSSAAKPSGEHENAKAR